MRSSLSVLAASPFVQLPLRAGDATRLHLVVRNARVFFGGRWITTDLGITDEGRLKVDAVGMSSRETIDAGGRVAAPGFIDVLADGTTSTTKAYLVFERFKLADGVTSALQMHGGSDEVARFYDDHGRLPHWVNYGVSTKVMTIRYRFNSIRQRLREVEKNLDSGSLGVSHSVEYQPTPWDELVEYARLARKYERPFFMHLRYSSAEKEIEGIREALRLARETGVRVHLDHLHSTGGTFNMRAALDLIREAVETGFKVTVGVYPYTYWATYLHSRRFDPGWQDRYRLDYADLQIVGTGERLTEESFARYRKVRGILVAVPPGTMPPESTIDPALREDFCLIGSDGGILSEPRANNHPRGAGCFATALRYGQSIGLSLEDILRKLTELPRAVVAPALDDRGVLADSARADLTIFDPETVDGNATITDPNQYSRGIHTVIVNGKVAYHDGQLMERNGMPVRARQMLDAT